MIMSVNMKTIGHSTRDGLGRREKMSSRDWVRECHRRLSQATPGVAQPLFPGRIRMADAAFRSSLIPTHTVFLFCTVRDCAKVNYRSVQTLGKGRFILEPLPYRSFCVERRSGEITQAFISL